MKKTSNKNPVEATDTAPRQLVHAGVTPPPLEAADIMRFERDLCEALRLILPFEAHSLHFPLKEPLHGNTAEYLDKEDRLLVPLYEDGIFLGLFVARGLDAKKTKSALPWLPGFCRLALRNIALLKSAETDAVTGLHHKHDLLAAAERMMRDMRETMRPGGTHLSAATHISGSLLPDANAQQTDPSKPEDLFAVPAGDTLPGTRQFCFVVLRLNGFSGIVRKHGFVRSEHLLHQAGALLLEHMPDGAMAARVGDHDLAVLLPGYGAHRAREAVQPLLNVLDTLRLRDDTTGKPLPLYASAGYAHAPMDMDGMDGMSSAEQARQLLRRARLAAALSASGYSTPGSAPTRVLGYADLLRTGGHVIRVAPLNRLLINLGRSCGAREGMAFSVWSAGEHPRHKGDVIIQETGENSAWADLINTADPSFPPEAGDRLEMLQAAKIHALQIIHAAPEDTGKRSAPSKKTERSAGGDAPALLSYAEFLPQWSRAREEHAVFCLALVRLGGEPLHGAEVEAAPQQPPRAKTAEVDEDSTQPAAVLPEEKEDGAYWNALMPQAALMLQKSAGSKALFCRMGLNTLLVFAPDHRPEPFAKALKKLLPAWATRQGLRAAAGIAAFPFMNYSRLDTLENSRKALHYALLLPEPHIGVADTLALNIAADRLFSRGDVYGAIEEYKQAILCDENNILARNSLGVALAGLGRHAEARRQFSEALQRSPKDLTALYNLGHLCQSAGETAQAAALYAQCLEQDAKHLYALYRMGQLAESGGDHANARQYYLQAQSLPGGAMLTRRSLARLLLKEGKAEEAREELHEALRGNPDDALALQLLAGVYLDAGEDPSVAESLARQSVAVRPDIKASWLVLARAFEASGKESAARSALMRAGELP